MFTSALLKSQRTRSCCVQRE